jgi:hypothetical protein
MSIFEDRERALMMAREDETKLDGLANVMTVINRAKHYLAFIQLRGLSGADPIGAANKQVDATATSSVCLKDS